MDSTSQALSTLRLNGSLNRRLKVDFAASAIVSSATYEPADALTSFRWTIFTLEEGISRHQYHRLLFWPHAHFDLQDSDAMDQAIVCYKLLLHYVQRDREPRG